MTVQVSQSDRGLIALATKNYNGIVKYGSAIPVTMVTAPQMLAAKTALQNSAADFQEKRDDLQQSYNLFHPGMDDLTNWLVTVRSVFGRILGETWSAAWAAAGFINNSTAVPDDLMSKIQLASSLEIYLTKNPSMQRPDMQVTADVAGDYAGTMASLQVEVTDAKEALRVSDLVRQPARATLEDLISTLLANLKKKLAPDDPRWVTFGFPIPTSQRTPAAPQNVVVSTDSAGPTIVSCPPVPLATRYRCRYLIVGVDTKYRLGFSGPNPMGMITSIAPGTTIHVIMQAVNGDAQSVASQPVVFTTPTAPVTSAPAVVQPDVMSFSAAVPASNGNGNGNGKHAVSRLA